MPMSLMKLPLQNIWLLKVKRYPFITLLRLQQLTGIMDIIMAAVVAAPVPVP
jgi:hypothetical protein